MYSSKKGPSERFTNTADALVILEETKKILKGMERPESHDKRVVIPVAAIDREENVRAEIKENEGFLALVASIEKLGLLQPLVVTPYKGRIKLVSGHRRLKAVERLGWKNVSVITKHLDYEKDFTLAQLVENTNREELSAIDHAEALFQLKEKGNYTNKEVGKIVGYHEKYINSLINIAKMPAKAKEFARKHEITVTTLKEIVKTKDGKDPKKIMEILNSVVDLDSASVPGGKSKKDPAVKSQVPLPVLEWLKNTEQDFTKSIQSKLERVGKIGVMLSKEERQIAIKMLEQLP